MYRRTLSQVVREQAIEFIQHTDLKAAPDATEQTLDGNMSPSVITDLLVFLNNRDATEEELEMFECTEEGLSVDQFLKLYLSSTGQRARLSRETLGWDALQGLQVGNITRIRSVEELPIAEPSLALPDSEASDLALAGETPFGRLIVPSKYETVKKQSQGWRKSWQARFLFVDAASGFGYYSKPVAQQDRGSKRTPKACFKLSEIVRLNVGENEEEADDKKKKKSKKSKPGLFQVKVDSGRTYTFAAENDAAAHQWCKTISSHVVIHAVKNNLGINRVVQFINTGGNVDASDGSNKQYPLLALAMSNGARDVAEYLIENGADPSCLLRWSFIMVDKISTSTDVLDLLLNMKHDLNICGDDQHRWNLLQYLCLQGEKERVSSLLEHINDTTVQAVNTIGDSALSLLLKASPEQVPMETAAEISMLLCSRSDINHVDNDGDSVLHLAVKRGLVELVHRLVQQGVNVNSKDSNGDTPLHCAIKLGRTDVAHAIIENATDLEIDLRDKANKDTAFVLAVKLGIEDMACVLLEHGASVNCWSGRWGEPDCREDQAIHMIIKMGMTKVALRSLEFKCDVTAPDSQGRTVLHLALLHNMFHVAAKVVEQYPQPERGLDYEHDEVIQEGSPVNICDTGFGESPLMMAFGLRELEVVCAILDAGARLNLCNLKRESPIHRAVQLCSVEHFTANSCRIAQSKAILETMLSTGDADPYLGCDPDLRTPFHQIACHENESSVLGAAQALLAHNPELPNARDAFGDSILISSIKHENYQVAHLVVSGGCNLDIVNSVGDSALHLAVKKGATSLLRSILQHGAYAGIWDRHGNCALHNAVAAGKVDCIEAFAEFCMQEGHLNHRTESGYSAAMVAIANAQVGALKTLMHYNVDLRLQLPKTRKGTLHLAVDTCMSEKVPVAVRVGIIDALFSVDSTELSVNSFKHSEKATGIFSPAKCYETLEQLQDNLVATMDEADLEIGTTEPSVETNDVHVETVAQEFNNEETEGIEHETKDAEEEEEAEEDRKEIQEAEEDIAEPEKNNSSTEEESRDSKGPKFGVPIPYASDLKQTANVSPQVVKIPIAQKESSARRKDFDSPFVVDLPTKKTKPNTEICNDDLGSSSDNNTEDDEKHEHQDDSANLVFLKNLSADDHERILEQIRSEARGTAEEWLSTNAGERMMQRRARELVKAANDKKEKLGHEDALEQARDAFIKAHIEESVQDVQKITENVGVPSMSDSKLPDTVQYAVSS